MKIRRVHIARERYIFTRKPTPDEMDISRWKDSPKNYNEYLEWKKSMKSVHELEEQQAAWKRFVGAFS